ncbi:MAG: hypothetical protein R3B65_03140 [Candidatus Paceibacterota bacterium]
MNNSGVEGNNQSYPSSISSDGRFVGITSYATNLIDFDSNGPIGDAFVYDRQTDTIQLISSNGGIQGNQFSGQPILSSNGRYVAFSSDASNLVPNDTNGVRDVFVYDRQTNTIERISLGGFGVESNGDSFSANLSYSGNYVTFVSDASNLVPNDTNGVRDVFVYDRNTHIIERVSLNNSGVEGNNDSVKPSISSNGRYVAFSSDASNLVPNDTNGVRDVFVYDRTTNLIQKISTNQSGLFGNAESSGAMISSNGQHVVFESIATNLVPNDTNEVSDISLPH